MKKTVAFLLATTVSLGALAGCAGKNNGKDKDETKNENAPVLAGISEDPYTFAGEEWDALAGVTASDTEDGNLTSKIKVECEDLTFSDGKVTPEEDGDYTVVYSVEDNGGKKTEKQVILTVYPESEELVEVFGKENFASAPTVADRNKAMRYWELVGGDEGNKATATLEKGALVVDVKDAGAQDDAVYLKRHFDSYTASKYRVIAYAESSVATKIKATASVHEQSVTYSSEEVEVKAGYQRIVWEITAEQNNLWFNILLGGGEGKPSAYKFSIYKLDIFKVIGTGEEEVLFEKAFTSSADGMTAVTGTEVTFDSAKNETHIAVTYKQDNPGGGDAKVIIPISGDFDITKGTQYNLSFVVKATNNLEADVCVDDKDKGWEKRAYFHTIKTNAGEETNIDLTLNWEDGGWQTLEKNTAVIALELGKHDSGLTTNDVVIKNVKLSIPGQTTREAHDYFALFGWDSAGAEGTPRSPVNVFNGTDLEDASGNGMSTVYVEDGKLVYRILEGADATHQGDNQLAIGFGNDDYENRLSLPKDSYYIITFTVKSSVELDFNLTLHDMLNQGGGKFDDGLLLRRADFEDSALHIGTTETTYTFIVMSYPEAGKYELLFEFGSAAVEGKSVTIEFSELSIGYRTMK